MNGSFNMTCLKTVKAEHLFLGRRCNMTETIKSVCLSSSMKRNPLLGKI
ncbi:MAG: hypothetical protein ACLVG1_09300 [Monoglobus pectinilyticus]